MRQAKFRFRKRTANILMLTVFFLVVMLAFVALSVDVGYIYAVKVRLQNAADSAACAGAIALADGEELAIPAAVEYAEFNRAYADEFTMLDGDVQLGIWDDETASFTALAEGDEGSPNAVRVSCHRTAARGNQVGLFFARIMGNDYTDIVSTATARYKTAKCGIVVGMTQVAMSGTTHVDSYESGEGPYFPGDAQQNGHVCSNGNIIITQSARIDGDAHPGEESQVLDYSAGEVSGSAAQLTTALEYPEVDVSEAAASNDNGTIPLSQNGVNPVNEAGQLVLNGVDHVDLPPGTYYFTRVILSGGATVGVSGETMIYVDGDVVMSGASIMNDTTIPQNLQFYTTGTSFTMSGTAAFYGVVYSPTARVIWSGMTDFHGSIIADQLLTSGMGGIHADDSLDLDILDTGVKQTALVD